MDGSQVIVVAFLVFALMLVIAAERGVSYEVLANLMLACLACVGFYRAADRGDAEAPWFILVAFAIVLPVVVRYWRRSQSRSDDPDL
jgi:hypothetical protein